MNIPLPLSLTVMALLSACSTQPPANAWRYSVPDHVMQPEAASGNNTKPGWAFTRQAVAAANPLATVAARFCCTLMAKKSLRTTGAKPPPLAHAATCF
jgi:hypothetical protein